MTATPVPMELPTGHYLRPNGHGGYIIRQSDLTSWWRCNLQKYYDDRAYNDPEAPQPSYLSATEYGTVVHHAVMVMEQAIASGHEDPLALGLRTFEHFWDPAHIRDIPGATWPTEWIATDTYGGLRERGRQNIRIHYDIIRNDKSNLLALEYQFAVPMQIGDVLHTLTGTVDRLAVRAHYNKPYISVDDNKTGKQPTFLRYNAQGSGYAWASTLPEFWAGWDESGIPTETFDAEDIQRLVDLFESWQYQLHREAPGAKLSSRRFRWINLKEMKISDGGWRTERDYARFLLTCRQYVKAYESEAYSLNTDGAICRYCSFRKTCAGAGIDEDEFDGAPNRRVNIP